jgi:hypothetical protein
MTLLIIALSLFFQSGEHIARKATEVPQIDGKATEQCWDNAEWYPIDQKWLGEEYTADDFQGRFKAVWDENYLYLLVEIVDDTLVDIYED